LPLRIKCTHPSTALSGVRSSCEHGREELILGPVRRFALAPRGEGGVGLLI
jgi:hypothetical protein